MVKANNAEDLLSVNQFTRVGEQKGSNPGGTYTSPNGEAYYLKFPAQKQPNPTAADIKLGEEMAKNEVLAAKLYELAGVKVPELSLIKDKNGNLGIASKIEPTFQSAENPENKYGEPRKGVDWKKLPGVQQGLAVDAWLCNWDAVGLAHDNIGTYKNPKTGKEEAFRLDTGGALIYRAQGELKGNAFGNDPSEIDTLQGKNPKVSNKSAANIFGGAEDKEIKKGAQAIANIDNNKIKDLVMQYGPGTEQEKEQLVEKLLARKVALMQRYNVQPQKAVEQKSTVKESAQQIKENVQNGFKELKDGLVDLKNRATGVKKEDVAQGYEAFKKGAKEGVEDLKNKVGGNTKKDVEDKYAEVKKDAKKAIEDIGKEAKKVKEGFVDLKNKIGGNKKGAEQALTPLPKKQSSTPEMPDIIKAQVDKNLGKGAYKAINDVVTFKQSAEKVIKKEFEGLSKEAAKVKEAVVAHASPALAAMAHRLGVKLDEKHLVDHKNAGAKPPPHKEAKTTGKDTGRGG